MEGAQSQQKKGGTIAKTQQNKGGKEDGGLSQEKWNDGEVVTMNQLDRTLQRGCHVGVGGKPSHAGDTD